jgi:hypothetical protein
MSNNEKKAVVTKMQKDKDKLSKALRQNLLRRKKINKDKNEEPKNESRN